MKPSHVITALATAAITSAWWAAAKWGGTLWAAAGLPTAILVVLAVIFLLAFTSEGDRW